MVPCKLCYNAHTVYALRKIQILAEDDGHVSVILQAAPI